MNTLSTIPTHDLPEFAALPDACRKEVREWMSVIAHLLNAPRIGAAIQSIARQMHLSPGSVRRYYDAWRATGDWRVFVNRAKYQPNAANLPAEFIQYWKKLCEKNQRKCEPQWRELIRRWKRGESIPGYSVLPPAAAHSIPSGWSYRNLMRYAPTKFELTAMRDGLGAAMAKYGPKLLTTRVGLWVGSHYIVDDVTRDFKVLLIGQGGKIARIQELGVLDLYSADRFAIHRRPEFTRDSDGKKDRIKEREMRFLIAGVLRNTGWSPRGTEFVTEGGTAAIREPLEKWMAKTISPLITVRGPGTTGREQVIAGYWGQGGGNPRHKAHLESHHNLIHNESGALLAQTGHDRSYPEWLHGVEAITNDVIKWMLKLPPERAAEFCIPMHEYWQGLRLLSEIDDQIAWRKDHNLEGWVECGHTTIEYRRDVLSEDWLSPGEFMALPDRDRAQLAYFADQHPGAFSRPRKLAPREVFAKGAQELCKVPDHVIALMFCDRDLGDDLRKSKTLRPDGTIEYSDSEITAERMIFEGHVIAPDGSRRRLDERTTYGAVLNYFDPDALWIYDKDGGFVGTAPRRERISQLDEPALHIALGEYAKTKSELLTPLRERHLGAVREITAMQEHNDRVKAGEAVTPEAKAAERATKRRIRSERGSISDLMPEQVATAPASEAQDFGEEYSLAEILPDHT